MFSDHTGELGPVALPGTPAPGTDSEFGIVGYQMLSDAGRLAFRATLADAGPWPPLGVWWDQPGEVGEIMALVVPGMPLPSDPSITIVSVNWLQGFSAAGHLVMRVVLQDAESVQHEAMMIASPEGALSVIVVAGEPFDIHGNGSELRQISGFHFGGINDAGEFVIRINFSDGTFGVYRGSANAATSVIAGGSSDSFHLAQNAPNPFAQSTTLSFSLVRPSPVELAVYDAAGRRVTTLLNESRTAGVHAVQWDGHDDAGAAVASGIYWARLHAAGESRTVRMVHLR
jgi:hypothetical protein